MHEKFQELIQCWHTNQLDNVHALLEELEPLLKNSADRALYNALSRRMSEPKQRSPSLGDRLSHFDGLAPRAGISIVSCSMNRNANLAVALQSWLQLPVDEIVIVDWSSDEPVKNAISDLDDERITIVRVENEPAWVLTYAFNVGLRFASYSKIYKLDADIEVTPDFVERNSFTSQEFVRGNYEVALENDASDQIFINGSFGANKSDLEAIGFYNELITTYGWDDSDLYERLSAQRNLTAKNLDFESLFHRDHSHTARMVHQNHIAHGFLGGVLPTVFNERRNWFIGRSTLYWSTKKLQDYEFIACDAGYVEMKRVSRPATLPHFIKTAADIHVAQLFLNGRHHSLLAKSSFPDRIATLFLDEYQSQHPVFKTLSLLGSSPTPTQLLTFDGSLQNFEDFGRKCLAMAHSTGKSVTGLARGEYSRVTMGHYPGHAEILTLPTDICEAVLELREKNGCPAIHIADVGKVRSPTSLEFKTRFHRDRVYIDAQHGLGNRLRAIASAAAIAESLDRELVIVWEPDHHCDCHFEDLFDYRGHVMTTGFLSDARECMDVFNYMTAELGSEKDALVVPQKGKDLYLRSAYVINNELSDRKRENQFIRELKVTAPVEELVKSVDTSHCVGVHVRMEAAKGLDHHSYDSEKNWTSEEHSLLRDWRGKSHYSHFIKHIDKLIDREPDLRLFVAADRSETYQVFKRSYDSRLTFLERSAFDRSKDQLQYALADAILLSQCNRLIGSTWSSFSELAQRLSKGYSSIDMSGVDF